MVNTRAISFLDVWRLTFIGLKHSRRPAIGLGFFGMLVPQVATDVLWLSDAQRFVTQIRSATQSTSLPTHFSSIFYQLSQFGAKYVPALAGVSLVYLWVYFAAVGAATLFMRGQGPATGARSALAIGGRALFWRGIVALPMATLLGGMAYVTIVPLFVVVGLIAMLPVILIVDDRGGVLSALKSMLTLGYVQKGPWNKWHGFVVIMCCAPVVLLAHLGIGELLGHWRAAESGVALGSWWHGSIEWTGAPIAYHVTSLALAATSSVLSIVLGFSTTAAYFLLRQASAKPIAARV